MCLNRNETGSRWHFLGSCGVSTQLRRKQSTKFQFREVKPKQLVTRRDGSPIEFFVDAKKRLKQPVLGFIYIPYWKTFYINYIYTVGIKYIFLLLKILLPLRDFSLILACLFLEHNTQTMWCYLFTKWTILSYIHWKIIIIISNLFMKDHKQN